MPWVTETANNWVTEARKYVNSTLAKLPKLVDTAFKDTAVDILTKELEKIPVPFVGTILSKMIKEAVKSTDKDGPGLEEVLERLVQMEQSDEDFLQGLADTGEDINRLEEIIHATRKDLADLRQELTQPQLQIKYPQYEPKYPQADQELWFSLLNTGGGAVKVPEIFVSIENWEPEIKVIYTAPAAPPLILRLKVRLSPDTLIYPLLKLNGEPYRRFGAYSEGAEDVCLQMSTAQNARYQVRIRVPFENLATGKPGELLYPAAGEPPLTVSFPYAPGWDPTVTPANMLARSAVLTEITTTFNKAKKILEASTPSREETQREKIDHQLRQLGFSMGLAYLPYVLNQFMPPVAQMIKEEQQIHSLRVLLELAHQSLRHLDASLPGALQLANFNDQAVEALCQAADRPEQSEIIRRFFTQPDEEGRQKMITKIISAF